MVVDSDCSIIIEGKLPPKINDSRSFVLTCNIGKVKEIKGLCDIRSSINLRPTAIFKKLGSYHFKPTHICL